MTSKGHERVDEIEKRETAGTWCSLVLPFPLVTLEVLSLCLSFFLKKIQSIRVYTTIRGAHLGFLELPWAGLWKGWEGGLIMSHESDGMCWSSFGHLSCGTSWRIV